MVWYSDLLKNFPQLVTIHTVKVFGVVNQAEVDFFFLNFPDFLMIQWIFSILSLVPLLFNMLSILVITFLPRSKRLLISWLQSPSAVILEPPKIKSDIVTTVSPSISHEVMGSNAMILVF